MKLTFDEWYKKVAHAVQTKEGMSILDLPDCAYHDWYDEGMTPSQAARQAIANAKDEYGL